MSKTVAVFVGSLRKGSINRQYARVLERLAGDRLAFRFVEIGDLPLYNDDLWQEGTGPDAVMRMKAQVEACDAVLIVTPEYNRNVPGLLTNALDWCSRPYGNSSLMGKPSACTGASPGAIGTAAAQTHLKAAMDALGLCAMGFPEVYLQWKPDDYDDATCKNDATRTFLQGFVDAFATHVERFA